MVILPHADITLTYLRPITGQELERNHVIENMHHPDSEDGYSVYFLKCKGANSTITTQYLQ